MEVEHDDGEVKLYCDVCGRDMTGDGLCNDQAEFTITMEYGSEDDCFGCGEGEHELHEKYGEDDMRDYLAQSELKPYPFGAKKGERFLTKNMSRVL